MLKNLDGHKSPVRCLLVLPDGNLASCAEDNMIIIWASKRLEVKYNLVGHVKQIWCVTELKN